MGRDAAAACLGDPPHRPRAPAGAAAPTSAARGDGHTRALPWGASAGRQTTARDSQRRLCAGAPPAPGRGPGGVVTADESPGDGFCPCVPGGAVVSLSVGSGTVFPGAQARVYDRTVARADRAAVTQCPGDLFARGLA